MALPISATNCKLRKRMALRISFALLYLKINNNNDNNDIEYVNFTTRLFL